MAFTVIVVQASMRYHPTQIGTPPDVKDCIPAWIRHDFEAIPKINIAQGCIQSCSIPGRLIVTSVCKPLIVLGNVASVHEQSIVIHESFARMIDSPLAEFLRVCVKHDLSLNKYLVAKTRVQI